MIFLSQETQGISLHLQYLHLHSILWLNQEWGCQINLLNVVYTSLNYYTYSHKNVPNICEYIDLHLYDIILEREGGNYDSISDGIQFMININQVVRVGILMHVILTVDLALWDAVGKSLRMSSYDWLSYVTDGTVHNQTGKEKLSKEYEDEGFFLWCKYIFLK